MLEPGWFPRKCCSVIGQMCKTHQEEETAETSSWHHLLDHFWKTPAATLTHLWRLYFVQGKIGHHGLPLYHKIERRVKNQYWEK